MGCIKRRFSVELILTASDPVHSRAEPCLVFCSVLSPSGAVSDNALLLFKGFSWPVFSEVRGHVLIPSLSQSGSSAETWVTLLVFEIPLAQLSASQQHAAASVTTDRRVGCFSDRETNALRR